MQLEVSGFDSFYNLLDADLYFSPILAIVRMGERTNFLVHEGFLFKGNQLCILDYSLRLRIIQELHEEGHVGRDRNLQLIHNSYFWPSMHKEMERFVERCQFVKCSRGKLLRRVIHALAYSDPALD